MTRPISTLEWRHGKTELLVYGLLLIGACVAGYAIEQWRQRSVVDRFWEEAERRGHAERHYDGPFDTQPTRRWKDAEEKAR